MSSTEPSSDNDAVQKSISEKKPDFEPGFDDKGSLVALDHCPKDKREDYQNGSVLYGEL